MAQLYIEKNVKPWKAFLIIAITFAIIYSPWFLGKRELHHREGRYAAMTSNSNILSQETYGEIIPNTYPLYPLVASLIEDSVKMEYALRWTTLAALVLLTILVGAATYNAFDLQTAIVAMASLISMGIIMEKGIDGYPHLLALLFVFLAWGSWFTYGAVKSKWGWAWVLCSISCGLAFLTIGWAAIYYTYIPLFFMRRPLTIWQRLKNKEVWIGWGILILFILLWGIPRWRLGIDIPFQTLPSPTIFTGYWKHILTFPFRFALRLFPWILIAWTPYCVAYHPLAKNKLFTNYLRVISISLLGLLWVSPFTRSLDIIFIIPPLAILSAANYSIVVRRHGYAILKLIRLGAYFSLIAAIIILAIYLVPAKHWETIVNLKRSAAFQKKFFDFGLIYSTISILISGYLIKFTLFKPRIWINTLLLAAAYMVLFWALIFPYKAQDHPFKDFGKVFRKALKKRHIYKHDLLIYKDVEGCYAEFYYLDCHIKRIRSFDELPTNTKAVYVISDKYPDYLKFNWESLAFQEYEGRRIYLLKGTYDKKQNK